MPAVRPEQMIVEEEPGTEDGRPNVTRWISEVGGLTQFGAFVQVLPPGARSSTEHWHAAEDEMIYMLDGEVTLVEGGEVTTLVPGDAATFKAGVPIGHHLENRSGRPVRCLVVGTRAPVDRVTYPGRGVVRIVDRSLPEDVFTDLDGRPIGDPFA